MMSKNEVAQLFSTGKFERVFGFIAENAEWIVVGEDSFAGRQAIIDNCEQVAGYFKSVETDFSTSDVISEGNFVVVCGTAEFLRAGQRLSYVSASDVYEFDDSGKILKITSYCITDKEK